MAKPTTRSALIEAINTSKSVLEASKKLNITSAHFYKLLLKFGIEIERKNMVAIIK